MRGHEAIVAGRLEGWRFRRIDVEVLQATRQRVGWTSPGPEAIGRDLVGRIEVDAREAPGLLDFRCCYGLHVLMVADSYETGWPVAVRVMDAEPASLHFASPEMVIRIDSKGMQTWEL